MASRLSGMRDFDPLRVQAIADAEYLLDNKSPLSPKVSPNTARSKRTSNIYSQFKDSGALTERSPRSHREAGMKTHKGVYKYEPVDSFVSIAKSIQETPITYAPAFKSTVQRRDFAMKQMDVQYNIHHDTHMNLTQIEDKQDVTKLKALPRRFATWNTDFHANVPSKSTGMVPAEERWCKYVRLGDKFEKLYEKRKGNTFRDSLRKSTPEPTDPLEYNVNFGKFASTIESVESSSQRMAIMNSPRYHPTGIYKQTLTPMSPDTDQGHKKSILKSVEDSPRTYNACFNLRFKERPKTVDWDFVDVPEVMNSRKPISQAIEDTPFKLSNVRSTVPRWKKEKERSPYDTEKMSMMIKKSRMYLIERKKNIRQMKAMGKEPEKKIKVDVDIPQIIADKVREHESLTKLNENNPVPGPGHDVEVLKAYAENWRLKHEELRKKENAQLYEGDVTQKHRYINEDLVDWVTKAPPKEEFSDDEDADEDIEERRRRRREREKRRERERSAKMKKRGTRESTKSVIGMNIAKSGSKMSL